MITPDIAKRLAEAACVDLRTIWKALAFGIETLRPLPRKRVAAAAVQFGVRFPSASAGAR